MNVIIILGFKKCTVLYILLTIDNVSLTIAQEYQLVYQLSNM